MNEDFGDIIREKREGRAVGIKIYWTREEFEKVKKHARTNGIIIEREGDTYMAARHYIKS